MSDLVTELDENSFKNFVKEGFVLVDFWAQWCGPCKIISPIVESLARKLHGKMRFGKLNVDEESELAQEFEIMSIPTLIIFKDGEQIDRIIGALTEEELSERLDEVQR